MEEHGYYFRRSAAMFDIKDWIQAESNSYHPIIQYARFTVFITFHARLALCGGRDDEPTLTKAKGHRQWAFVGCTPSVFFLLSLLVSFPLPPVSRAPPLVGR